MEVLDEERAPESDSLQFLAAMRAFEGETRRSPRFPIVADQSVSGAVKILEVFLGSLDFLDHQVVWAIKEAPIQFLAMMNEHSWSDLLSPLSAPESPQSAFPSSPPSLSYFPNKRIRLPLRFWTI
jgi:hypothetical protein